MLVLLQNRWLSQRKERGDTLVEVTIALAILASVLASSFALADLAFRVGQTSKERTQAVNFIQEQAEALHNYRDNKHWAGIQALDGRNFFMTNNGTNWVPDTVTPTPYVPLLSGTPSVFNVTDTAALDPGGQKINITITVTWRNNGIGPANRTSIVLHLVNTDGIVPGCSTGPGC